MKTALAFLCLALSAQQILGGMEDDDDRGCKESRCGGVVDVVRAIGSAHRRRLAASLLGNGNNNGNWNEGMLRNGNNNGNFNKAHRHHGKHSVAHVVTKTVHKPHHHHDSYVKVIRVPVQKVVKVVQRPRVIKVAVPQPKIIRVQVPQTKVVRVSAPVHKSHHSHVQVVPIRVGSVGSVGSWSGLGRLANLAAGLRGVIGNGNINGNLNDPPQGY